MSIARREKVLTLLRENGTVMLKELEKLFPEVSSMTLRRDLEYFENLGEAVRIRGGARYIRTIGEQGGRLCPSRRQKSGRQNENRKSRPEIYRAPPLGLYRRRLDRNVSCEKSSRP